MNSKTDGVVLRHKYGFVFSGFCLGLLLTTVFTAVAQPGPDSGLSIIPYQGVLQVDGVSINASGENALSIIYTFFDGPDAEANELYSQEISTEVYEGRFAVGIGPVDANGRIIADMVRDNDDIFLSMTIAGVQMANRQRLLATPYSMVSSAAVNFDVAGNVNIDGELNFRGSLAGDRAFVRQRDEANEATILEIGVTNDANDYIRMTHNGATKLSVGESVTIDASTFTARAVSATSINAPTVTTTTLEADNVAAANGGASPNGFSRNDAGTGVANLTPVSGHFCALTFVRFGHKWDETAESQCNIVSEGGMWKLKWSAGTNERRNGCAARCMRFR